MPEPVVLIPGLQSDGTSWLALFRHLARRYPLVVPMGHQYATSIAEMGRRVLDQSPARFHLVGWSMGGYVAFEILRRCPERLLSLTLMATTAAPESDRVRVRREESLAMARQQGVRTYQEVNLAQCFYDPDAVDRGLWDDVVNSAELLGLSALESQTAAIIARRDSRPDLAGCRCPVLVTVGRDDAIIPPAHSREMHGLVPGAAYREIADCGHCPPLERPEALSGILCDWFDGVEAKREGVL